MLRLFTRRPRQCAVEYTSPSGYQSTMIGFPNETAAKRWIAKMVTKHDFDPDGFKVVYRARAAV